MRIQKNILRMKEQEKKPEKSSNEKEINDLPDKEFKEAAIRMHNKLDSRREQLRENFNKVRKFNKGPIRDEECHNWNEKIH